MAHDRDNHLDNTFDDTFLPVTSIMSGIGQAVMPEMLFRFRCKCH